mgnify:FL=1
MDFGSVSGVTLVAAGTLLLLPAAVPGTGWFGVLAALPAGLALIYGTLLVARSGEGRAV